MSSSSAPFAPPSSANNTTPTNTTNTINTTNTANPTTTDTRSLEDQFAALYNHLSLFKLQIAALHKHLRQLERRKARAGGEGAAATAAAKRKPRKPSGFARPAYISPALCRFLGVPEGTEVARTEITRRLHQYIKEHALVQAVSPERRADGSSEARGRRATIRPDAALGALLAHADLETTPLTYFTLQTYMNVHYRRP